MTNAYEELICELVEINKKLEDIKIVFINYINYNTVDSLKKINYNSGYGSQELYGYIVFKDNTWLERHEYDGSEWWEYKDIKEVLKKVEEWK